MLNFIKDNWVSITKGPAHLLLSKITRENKKTVCVYGAGEIGDALVKLLKEQGDISIEMVFDRKAEYIPMQLEEFTVKEPSAVTEAQCGCVVVASEKFVDEIVANLNKLDTNNSLEIITV